MNDENISTNGDWRLQGQEEFLQGVQLYWRHYARYSENWDHDHCEFCGVKFMVEDLRRSLWHKYDRVHYLSDFAGECAPFPTLPQPACDW